MPFGILVLSVLKAGTGNYTTASRISSYLAACEHFNVHLKCCSMFSNADDVRTYVQENMVDLAFGIHLYRSGKLLVSVDVPFCLIIGGTDINCCVSNEHRKSIMTSAVKKAKFIIAFSNEMKANAMSLWHDIPEQKFLVQPQAVTTCPSITYSFKELQLGLENNDPACSASSNVFLSVCGIRQVKDPMFVAEAVSRWHKENPSVHLFIVGPDLDDRFAEKCRSIASTLPGVHMCSYVEIANIHALMKQAVALVNTSISEGMAIAILEAMQLGIPVLARRNQGNMSIIRHGENGLLFSSEDEFIALAKLLLSDTSLHHRLAINGRKYVDTHHNCEKELITYCRLAESIVLH